MKLRFSLILTLCAGLSLSSCTINVPELDDTTLSLSAPSHFEVGGEGGEQIVNVSTNAEKWTALAGAPWITATPKDGQLAIYVAPNTTGEERTATVVITAGAAQQKLTLRQAAKANLLELNNNSLQLTSAANSYVVPLTQAEGLWSATQGEQTDWLKVVAQPERQQLLLKVEENHSTTPRVGKVYLRNAAGSVVRDLTVHQAARPLYLLPTAEYFGAIADALNSEQARGASVISMPQTAGTGSYVLSTPSPLFANVTYTAWENRVTSATLNTRDKHLFRDSKARLAQHNFLLDQGFKLKEQTQFFSIYEHAQTRVRAVVDAESEQNSVRFEQTPQQTESVAAITSLPIGLPASIDPKASVDDLTALIVNYEMGENANELDEAMTLSQSSDLYTALWFNIAAPKAGEPLSRIYFVRNSGDQNAMVGYTYQFAEISPYVYFYKGVPFVTRELDAYLTSQGYTFFRAYDARVMYANEKLQHYLTISLRRNPKREGYLLEIMVQYY